MIELTDEEIVKIAETLGRHIKGQCDYNSWGMGYRLDSNNRYSIPVIPANTVPFARAIEKAIFEKYKDQQK